MELAMQAQAFEHLDELDLGVAEEEWYIIASIFVLDAGVGVCEEIEIVLAAEADEVAEDGITCFGWVVIGHVLLDEGLDGTALDDGAELLFLQHFYREVELLALEEIGHLEFEAQTRGVFSSNGTIGSEETFQSPRIFGKNLFELLIGDLLLRPYL